LLTVVTAPAPNINDGLDAAEPLTPLKAAFDVLMQCVDIRPHRGLTMFHNTSAVGNNSRR